MGEPAIAPPAERAHILDYARRLVEAERNDYPIPEATWPDGEWMPVDEAMYHLARELETTADERDHAERGIAAFIAKHADCLDPKVESSARKFLLELAADINASRWPRQPREQS